MWKIIIKQNKNKYPFLDKTDFERIRELAKVKVMEKLKRKFALRGEYINVK